MNRSILLGAAMLLSGCATTQITNEWKNPDVVAAGPYKKVLLTAITGEETVRRQAEDAFHDALAVRKVTGVQSYKSLSGAEKANKAQLVKAVKVSGADAALVVRMVKKESKVSVMPTYYGPTGYYGGYDHAWDDFYAPSSVYQYDVVTLEAQLYDVETEKLVLVISTETTDPGKLQKEISAYSKLICDRLAEIGMF